jgi:CHAD domain-containing protein
MEEIELHYLIPHAATYAMLRRLAALGPLTLQARGQVQIYDRYLDTWDRALLRQGWGCRLRREDGRWLVTLKAVSRCQDVRASRTELEIALSHPSIVPADWPAGELRDKVSALSGGTHLSKLVTVRQVRRRALVVEDSRQIAELDLDRVDLRHGDITQRAYILEIELFPQGVPADLDLITFLLVHHFSLLPDARSKLQRALELAALGHSPEYDPSVRYPAKTLDELLQRYDIDPDHAAAVTQAAEHFFRLLQPVHHLDDSLLPILKAAAMLHDTGRSVSKKQHQIQGYQQLLLQPLADLPDTTRIIVAVTAFLHRGQISSARLAQAIPHSLPPAAIEQASGIAALVRLAAGLTPRRTPGVHIGQVAISTRLIAIELLGARTRKLERRIQRKSNLWQLIYGKKLAWRWINLKRPLEPEPVVAQDGASDILPQDSIRAAGIRIMSVQVARMISGAEAVRLAQDPEAIHNLRVACRRLRSAFRVFGDTLVDDNFEACRIGLRVCGDMLGSVRNQEVMLGLLLGFKMSDPTGRIPAMDSIVGRWEKTCDQARRSLVDYIEGKAFKALIAQLQHLVCSPDSSPAIVKRRCRVKVMAKQHLHSASLRVLAYDKVIKTASLEELHKLRIECKRLRYSLEFFRSLLGSDSAMILTRLVDTQIQLGALHDWYVCLAALDTGCTDELAATEIEAVNAFRAYSRINLNQAYLGFLSSWRSFANSRVQNTLHSFLATL